MKFLKLHLVIIALVIFSANMAFAAFSYNVSVDTASLNGTNGYLYFSYIPVNGADSTATVSNFFTDGSLYATNSLAVFDGSAVTGMLPGSLVFANTNGVNDYNHGITFGNTINFVLALSTPVSGGIDGGSNTFSLGLFQDEDGLVAALNGTQFTVDMLNDGSTAVQMLTAQTDVTPTPIPAAAWLFVSGLAGLVGVRRKMA